MYAQQFPQNPAQLAQDPMVLAALSLMAQRQRGASPYSNPSPLAGVHVPQPVNQSAYTPFMPGAFNASNSSGGSGSSGGMNPGMLMSILKPSSAGGGGFGGMLAGLFGPSAASAGGQYASLLGGSKGAGNAINSSGMSLADMLGNGMIAM